MAVPEIYTCSCGHQWEATANALPLATEATPRCPVCGEQVVKGSSSEFGDATRGTLSPSQMPPLVDTVRAATPVCPTPPPQKPDAHELATIPGYEVLGVLGRGGMGVVYKARQIALNRLVALKVISAGTHASPQQLARFHLEAEAVASLQHPNIVQIYEVSEHSGCPFFSLEFVDGGSLDKLLHGRPQPARSAAELVEKLARAMHCAHQRGVVHRDLKPANILLQIADFRLQNEKPQLDASARTLASASGWSASAVGSSGQSAICNLQSAIPKIADFGLAKRLEDNSQTQTGAILGTPSYMAPEQAAGNPKEVGPRTDVYALGAILYEMLTGRPPFGGKTTFETLQQVQAQEPAPLAQYGVKVARDLEIICRKCLEKEPAKRYTTAEDLAEDLRRFLADEPIRARPATKAERLYKWVKRRPAWAALVLVSGLAALGLVAGGLWHHVRLRAERDRAEANYETAEKNFRLARRAVEEMLTEVAEEQLVREPRMEQKRRALLEKALTFYKEFLQEKSSDPALRKDTALAYKRVADISRLLRQDSEAEDSYRQAISLLRQLVAEFPGDPTLRQQLAECHNFHGEVLRLTERPRAAQHAYSEALRIQRELVAEFPWRPAYLQDLARTHYNLGILSKESHRLPEAKEQFDQAINLLRPLAHEFHDKPKLQQHLARCYLNLGPVLRMTDGFQEAKEVYEEALVLLRDLKRQDPDEPEYQYELAVTSNNLGILLAGAGHNAGALNAHREALALFEKLVTNFPQVPVYRYEMANTCNDLGTVLAQQRHWPEAQRQFEQAREHFEKLVRAFPEIADYRARLAMTIGNLGWLLTEQKRWQEARPLFETAIRHLQRALQPNPENHFCLQALRKQYQSLAETLVQLGDHAPAVRAATDLPGVFQNRAQDYYNAACFVARCIPLAATDTRLPAKEREAVARQYGDQVLQLLHEAVRRDCTALERLANEQTIFRPLAQRDEFRQILADLDTKTRLKTAKTTP